MTTLGRSGSTWLMQLLAAHPEVVVFRRFPYESAPAKYWLHMLRVLSEPGNLSSPRIPRTSTRNRWWVGSNPYHDDRVYEQVPLENWFGGHYIEQPGGLLPAARIDDWYLTLARTQAQPAAVYFAEKHVWPNYLPGAHLGALSARPRSSSSCATSATWRGRSWTSTRGAATRASAVRRRFRDEEYMRGGLRQMADDLSASWQRARGSGAPRPVRGPRARAVETFTGILEYLGLDASPETVREVLEKGSEQVLRLPGASFEAAEVMAHRTVPDPRATIGRWRQGGDDHFAELSQEVFGAALSTFGYA